MLHERFVLIVFSRFLKMVLPSFTATTMVEKLSFNKIISAASCATLEPFFPIAIPISALFKLNVSFTPSPVTATISPCFISISTIRNLSSGDTLENINALFWKTFFSCLSVIDDKSAPLIITGYSSFSFINPIFLEIAFAVTSLSTVIINTFMCALKTDSIAAFTSLWGGSNMVTNPAKVKSFSASSTV